MSFSFHRFYESWFDHLRHLSVQLAQLPQRPEIPEGHRHYRQLVEEVMSHYAAFYRVKSLAARADVLSLFAAPWCTSLERSLHWVAGFRPTTFFHIVYTESSIRFESQVFNILRGKLTGDLGELSPETVKSENEISKELSQWQDGLVTVDWDGLRCDPGCMEWRLGHLVQVVEKADRLRLETLNKVVELLTSQQAVEFLTAVAELQFGIRSWGLNLDRLLYR
ncbi:hypothetical protein Nepgr_007425 [Nepenthes gracilis]|uniref:DOG1 domain-containing protein n=1 Tax=Nepenthes gracilis TaxID=150966 RepID=A0AAD3S713_NEPGR|nr:hypothetical protein Nepgr_007425 [Nepenthes gracilis]